MKHRSIAFKLLLLAGVPVLGALLLAGLVVTSARDQLRRTEALGSVESLAELAEAVSSLTYRLQLERARLALELGTAKGRELAELTEDEESKPLSGANPLAKTFAETDQALDQLRAFIATRDLSRLPSRLSQGLSDSLHHLDRRDELRRRAKEGKLEAPELMEYYRFPTRRLILAVGALNELTDDGELLRTISSLVAILELRERASGEHALLDYVFAAGEFPPGTFRGFVALLTEEATFVEVLRTDATADQFEAYQRATTTPAAREALKLREVAQNVTEGDYGVDASKWNRIQAEKIEALRQLEQRLNGEVRQRAMEKIQSTQQALFVSSGLAGSALIVSVLLAIFIGRGVTHSVRVLRDAAQAVGKGATDVRVKLRTRDELQTLGEAFNNMTGELARARVAMQEKARMARDLEIAAGIQGALLPPSLAHPEFEFAGRMRPADEVGGDFYDVLCDEKSGALWLTIGDVSGHGVPAGLVMLITQSAFAAFFRANPLARPDEVIRGVNDLLSEQIGERLRDDKYVTGLLMAHAGQGNFVFAGAHEWPLIWRRSQAASDVVEAPGPWLGIKREIGDVPVSSLKLEQGDILCLYSDGLIEARDADGDLFDVHRLQEAVDEAAANTSDLGEIADRVLARIDEYAERREDDWTLLLVRRAA